MLKFSDINAFRNQSLEPPCRNGFTLSELLMALTIVGVIAVLTVPVMMNNIHNKMFATQVKNMAATIEQLAQDQLIVHRTRDLSDTDFGDPEKLLTDKHFAITKTCSSSSAAKDCWKTAATGKDKVTYKNLNKQNISLGNAKTIILKNGVILLYNLETSTDSAVGYFIIDINGNDNPNIVGRDLFAFFVTPKGRIADISSIVNANDQLNTKISKCKNDVGYGFFYCYGTLVDSGWKMDY